MPNEVTIEKMHMLASPILKSAITRLILGVELTEQEIDLIAHTSEQDVATVVVHLTSEQLMSLQKPNAILSVAAAIYGKIADSLDEKNGLERNNHFKQSMESIKLARARIESESKGQNR